MPTEPSRPKLCAYRVSLRMSRRALAETLGVSTVAVGRYELPFGDADRRVPREEVLAKIHAWSDGQVTPGDFYPPELAASAGALELQA